MFMTLIKPRAAANTRFIQFGRKYKAFAKAVPSGRKFIFALQMAKKHCIIVSNISVENGFKTQTEINRENVRGKLYRRRQINKINTYA